MPHLAYDTEKSLYILNDGYVGFGFVSMPLSGVDDTVTQRLNAFLTFDYPEGSFIQIMLLASPDIRVRMDAMLNMRDVEGSKSLKKSAENRLGLFVAATVQGVGDADLFPGNRLDDERGCLLWADRPRREISHQRTRGSLCRCQPIASVVAAVSYTHLTLPTNREV